MWAVFGARFATSSLRSTHKHSPEPLGIVGCIIAVRSCHRRSGSSMIALTRCVSIDRVKDHRKAESIVDSVSNARTVEDKKKHMASLIKGSDHNQPLGLYFLTSELSVHTAVEERIVYPVLPAVLEDTSLPSLLPFRFALKDRARF